MCFLLSVFCVCYSDHQISMIPSIPFPLARPTTGNILAICHYSNLRPRYTRDMLPKSGFGHLYRQASAVNQLESWFSVCCSNGTQDEEMTLCCAQQAVSTQDEIFHIIPYNSVCLRDSKWITQCVKYGTELGNKWVVKSSPHWGPDLLNIHYSPNVDSHCENGDNIIML